MKTFLYVALGGAIGAVLRYVVTLLLKPESNEVFPIHTFMVNTIGCLLIGLVFAYVLKTIDNTHLFQYFIITGILGGFTTFSSYTMEAVYLLDKAKQIQAVSYILLSNVCGIGAAWLGFNLQRIIG